MATPSKQDKTLIEYNCKNGVYSVDGGEVKPLTFLSSITLDRNINTTDKYGDGEIQLTLIRDSGLTGSIETTARDYDLEKDLGYVREIDGGMAEVQALENKSISIGFECYITDNKGVTKTKKVWLFNVNVSPASTSLSQNTDTINDNAASYSVTVKGVNLKTNSGDTDFTDENGNTLKVVKMTSLPTDTGYAEFLDSVPTPKEKAV